jgi:peptidoglycan/LPS O-acetylase OafA/YrhL
MAAIAPASLAVKRLAWLDALRGFAAMLVVYEHLTHGFFNSARAALERWFLAGYAGVCLFFVVSGYIIPASLERRDLRAFWIGRIFRLYPLYIVVLVAVVLLHFVGLRPLDSLVVARPMSTALAHATMLSTLLGVPDLLGVTWTLAFEMTFYLVVASLHTARLGRASPFVAIGLAATSVAATPLPLERLSTSGRSWMVVAVATIAILASIGAMASQRRVVIVGGGVLGAVLAVLLLGWNQNPAHVGDGLLIPALMFTGTTLHRVEHGQIARGWAVVVPCAVVGAWCVQLHRDAPTLLPPVAITLAVVALSFAVGWLGRAHAIPRALRWLGVVSYSLYLIHRVVLDVALPSIIGGPGPSQASLAHQAFLSLALLAAILVISGVSYRFVERPAQDAGRKIMTPTK